MQFNWFICKAWELDQAAALAAPGISPLSAMCTVLLGLPSPLPIASTFFTMSIPSMTAQHRSSVNATCMDRPISLGHTAKSGQQLAPASCSSFSIVVFCLDHCHCNSTATYRHQGNVAGICGDHARPTFAKDHMAAVQPTCYYCCDEESAAR